MGWTKGVIKLRPYQKKDSVKLYNDETVLIASDTGTGKTATYIRAAELVFEHDHDTQKCVILCPPNTKYQVYKEIKRFTNSKAILIDGGPHNRHKQYKRAVGDSVKYIVFGMSVTLYRERDLIEQMLRKISDKTNIIGVVDEAYVLKNGPRSDTSSKTVKALFRFRAYIKYRWPATATPVKNRPSDMFWVYNWMDPKILGTKEKFDKDHVIFNTFGQPTAFKNLKKFHKKIAPYLIRHKEDDPDVAPYLPKVIQENFYFEFEDGNSKRVYDKIRMDTLDAIESLLKFPPDDECDAEELKLKNQIIRAVEARYLNLQMLCVGGTKLLLQRAKVARMAKKKSYIRKFVKNNPQLFEKLSLGPKLVGLAELVDEILRENPKFKVVIFCYFRDVVDDVYDILSRNLKTKCKIILAKGGQNFDTYREEFNTQKSTRVFITTDANKAGADLPAGSHLLQLDLPPNYAEWWQRATRIRRTSSKFKHVKVFNLIMRNTVEERRWDHIERTKELSAAIVDNQTYKRDLVKAGKRVVKGLRLHSSSLFEHLAETLMEDEGG